MSSCPWSPSASELHCFHQLEDWAGVWGQQESKQPVGRTAETILFWKLLAEMAWLTGSGQFRAGRDSSPLLHCVVRGPETSPPPRSLVACRISDPNPDLLSQNLHLSKSPRWSAGMLEKTASQLPHLMGYSLNDCPSET